MGTPLDDVQSLLAGPQATAEPEITAFNDDAVVDEPQPVKRPRGRPRKVPNTGVKEDAATNGKPIKVEIPMPKPGVLAEGVANVYVFAGMGLATVRPQTGMALASNAEDCGKAWEALAAQNPAVRRALMSLLQTSAWGALIGAHIPIIMLAVQEGQQLSLAKREKEAEGAAVSEGAGATVFSFVQGAGNPGNA